MGASCDPDYDAMGIQNGEEVGCILGGLFYDIRAERESVCACFCCIVVCRLFVSDVLCVGDVGWRNYLLSIVGNLLTTAAGERARGLTSGFVHGRIRWTSMRS